MEIHKINPFLSIKNKLLVFTLCISLIPIITITAIYYLNARSTLKHEILEKLKGVAESKRLHTQALMRANEIRIRNISSDGYIRDKFEIVTRGGTSSQRTVARLNTYLLKNKKRLYSEIIAIMLVDKYGKVISSSNEKPVGTIISHLDVFQQGMKKNYGDFCVGQPHYSPYLHANCILVSAPIISRQGVKIGVAINAYSLTFLDEITIDPVGMGKTGEVYLANRDMQMITKSRFTEGEPLKQTVSDSEFVRKTIEKSKGAIDVYTDYRGVSVIGVLIYMPKYNWILVTKIDTTEAFAPLRPLRTVALILGIVSSTAAILLGITFAVSTSNPIKILTNATERLAGGELDYRVTIRRKDEIGNLALSFNTMAEELRNEIHEHRQTENMLEDANKNLQLEIIERKEIEEMLRKQRDHLQYLTAQLTASNTELEAFCYSVSHDLRSPLRGIDGFSRALLEDYDGKLDTQGKNYLQRINTACHRMGQLIDDLLNLSRITRSKMNKKSVDLGALAKTIAAELREKYPGRQVEFVIADGLIVHGDSQLLKIALNNLLNNAWKFSQKRSRAKIEFGTTRYKENTAFFIRDNGVGFDMAYSNKLFGAFQRLHSATEFEGTGIGLATVQRIIHRHGGQIWAEGGVDQGATFYFTLS
ncbi:MAG: Sensory box histidine kinase [Candidatus Jettenia ecosi]|uniref:histidine kinase n=1 Tax=Candidatus Jettenia ecosi TaxID=2494326 RepID=A0A533Q5Y6_9BACT|nr:MAG: Sensory box histidine kinase [Candidatus Jettenia ecosi]